MKAQSSQLGWHPPAPTPNLICHYSRLLDDLASQESLFNVFDKLILSEKSNLIIKDLSTILFKLSILLMYVFKHRIRKTLKTLINKNSL